VLNKKVITAGLKNELGTSPLHTHVRESTLNQFLNAGITVFEDAPPSLQ